MLYAITLAVLGVLQGKALLVSTDKLMETKDLLLVDARPAEAFAQGHIAGAANLDTTTLSETRDGVANMLKPVDKLKPLLEAAGVDPKKHIVIYMGMQKADDLKDGARLFWILEYLRYRQVSLLDGGLAKWQKEGRAVESGPSSVKPIQLTALTPDPSRLATMDRIQDVLRSGHGNLYDMRAPEFYKGDKKADIVKTAGHIPSACNLPADDFVNPDMTVKPVADVQAKIEKTQPLGEAPVITYCNSGRSASTGYFMFRLIGEPDISMYDGSMAEWTASGKNPVETKEPAAAKK